MASKTKFTQPPQWWRHLRPYWKKLFLRRERRNAVRRGEE